MYNENVIFLSVFLLAKKKKLHGLSYNSCIFFSAAEIKPIVYNKCNNHMYGNDH